MNLSDANDDATKTPKQTGVHTLPHFLIDALNGLSRRIFMQRAAVSHALHRVEAVTRIC